MQCHMYILLVRFVMLTVKWLLGGGVWYCWVFGSCELVGKIFNEPSLKVVK